MSALILNGASKDDLESLLICNEAIELLKEKGYVTEEIMIEDKNIHECIGCFSCWVKSPGECIFKDDGSNIVRSMINSDVLVLLTPVIYGGYSSLLKLSLDRILPLLLPFFKKVKGEVHHKERYSKYPQVIVVGVMKNNDPISGEIFMKLIKRNALNWYNTFTGGIIIKDSNSRMSNDVKELFNQVEVRM